MVIILVFLSYSFLVNHNSETISDPPELTFSNEVPMSSVMALPRTGEEVPLLIFGCLNGAIFVHLEGESIPLHVLTFHSQNGLSLLKFDLIVREYSDKL